MLHQLEHLPSQNIPTRLNVRYWHEADIPTRSVNGPYQLRRSNSGSLAMPAAIRRAALRVNNLASDRRPTPSP